jgi:hypothetical protein
MLEILGISEKNFELNLSYGVDGGKRWIIKVRVPIDVGELNWVRLNGEGWIIICFRVIN